MIILEFLPNDVRVLEHNRIMPPNEDSPAGFFSDGWWNLPVRYHIGGVELLSVPQPPDGTEVPWCCLPITYAGIWFLDCIEEAWRGVTVDFDPGELGTYFRYRRVGDGIEIYSGLTEAKGWAPYEEHVAACRSFADRLQDYLVSLAPELREQPYLGSWFRGETYLPARLLEGSDRDPNA